MHELSPTPSDTFCLDFFLHKHELKLNGGKLLFFGENVCIIEKNTDLGTSIRACVENTKILNHPTAEIRDKHR